MGTSFTLHSNRKTVVTGTIAAAPYTINLSTYYLIGKDYVTGSDIRWNELYGYLFSNIKNNLRIEWDLFVNLISEGSDLKIHRLAVGTSINHGIYGLMSRVETLSLPDNLDNYGGLSDILNAMVSSMDGLFDASIELEEDVMPPNQTEHLVQPMIGNNEFFIPINPRKQTVRRSLAYANYILDANSVMDAEPGRGYTSIFNLNDWNANWFIAGELRRFFNWRRRRQGGLTYDDAEPCSNSEIGATTMSDWLVPVWKGMEPYRKNESSVAWIPFELFAWPCSTLYRFYSAASYVDTAKTCQTRNLPMGCLLPLVITSPVGSIGFSSFQHISKLALYCAHSGFSPNYGRPYSDDSDGSGVWHGLA